MKKTAFLLSAFICSVIATAQCFVEPIEHIVHGADNRPSNQFPPTEGAVYIGSAPMTVTFTTKSNSAILQWTYVNELSPDVEFTIGRNTTEATHTFDRFGRYTVRVEAQDEGCVNVRDSIQISVSESKLEVPNVFTPNNDGQNDQFCVAYKSIVRYQMYVYNRWGRLVFQSDRPNVCWDGLIGGKPADIGPYYYVIEAEGAEGHRYKLGGDINLVR